MVLDKHDFGLRMFECLILALSSHKSADVARGLTRFFNWFLISIKKKKKPLKYKILCLGEGRGGVRGEVYSK